MPDLSRFLDAQRHSYPAALSEIRNGRKHSHWMWYIFPQIAGLGFSSTAQYYAIQDLSEARAYLEEPTLRFRLLEISQALLEQSGHDAEAILGWPDNLKLRSSMTLFLHADPSIPVFQKVLDKFYDGIEDERTVALLDE
ncbi:MAG: DUF1810 domain-containing protein [Oscillospiraceae bacterium]|nr:DUF1810 domain-containing protein [Oscillospiraceae bacterium]